jgi:hypothetical protein
MGSEFVLNHLRRFGCSGELAKKGKTGKGAGGRPEKEMPE